MGDLAYVHVSEFSESVEGVQYVTHWQWNAVSFRYKMRVILSEESCICVPWRTRSIGTISIVNC